MRELPDNDSLTTLTDVTETTAPAPVTAFYLTGLIAAGRAGAITERPALGAACPGATHWIAQATPAGLIEYPAVIK